MDRRDEGEARLELRQARIDDDDVGVGAAHRRDRLCGLAGGAHDLDAISECDQPGKAVPDAMVGVHDEDPLCGQRSGSSERR